MNPSGGELPGGSVSSEDPFFILRDARTLFQRRMVDIARHAGVGSTVALDAFSEAIGEAHDALVAAREREGFEQAAGLTASRITLMCDSDLELEIRIGDIARRIPDLGGNPLWRTQLRYMNLLHRTQMSQEQNPVGPAAISEGLWALCHAHGTNVEANLALLARIEASLGELLSPLYAELNQLLTSRSVDAAQVQPVSPGGARGGELPAGTAAAGAYSQNPLAALQEGVRRQNSAADAGAPGSAALSAATLAMLQQLAQRLDALQPPSGEGGRPHTVRADDLGVPLGQSEAVALDTLARIFDAIFETWELPDTVKTAIGRLQIPLLRLAIRDPGLFSDSTHPARRLVNGMARAAVGLPRNVGRAHPVSARLWQLASRVAETLQDDPGVLAAPLADLDLLIAERDQSVREAAQPWVPLLRERESRTLGEAVAQRWFEEIDPAGLAPEIHAFLAAHWRPVMREAYREDGGEGAAWAAARGTVDDLLWSLRPKQGAEERQRLAALIPDLLGRIRAGFDRIGTPPEQRAPFLDACFRLQTNALRGAATPAGTPPPSAPATPAAPADRAVPPAGAALVDEIVEAGGRQLRYRAPAGDPRAGYRSTTVRPQVGDWLQFVLDGGDDPLCGELCWQNPASGTVLIHNPDWPRAIALAPAALDQCLRDPKTRVPSSQALFDQAAERALAQLDPR